LESNGIGLDWDSVWQANEQLAEPRALAGVRAGRA